MLPYSVAPKAVGALLAPDFAKVLMKFPVPRPGLLYHNLVRLWLRNPFFKQHQVIFMTINCDKH